MAGTIIQTLVKYTINGPNSVTLLSLQIEHSIIKFTLNVTEHGKYDVYYDRSYLYVQIS